MKGFKDIDNVEICEGDEILYTSTNYGSGSSDLERATVSRFTEHNMFYAYKGTSWDHYAGKIIDTEIETRMERQQTSSRVLVLKGEFKEYGVVKDLTQQNV